MTNIFQEISNQPDTDVEILKQPMATKNIDNFSTLFVKTETLSNSPPKPGEDLLERERILNLLRPDDPADVSNYETDQESSQLTLTLQDLEKDFRAAPDVLIAVSELEESLSLLEQKQARSGLKIFGRAGVGAYQEPVTDIINRDYQRARVGLGLLYPLLGSLEQERIDLLKAEALTREKEQEIELISQKSLGTLRNYYINYWGSQRKIELSYIFLENERDVEKILEHRKRAGYLLDADRQEFLSAFALVRRNIANLKTNHNRAFNILRLITKPDLISFRPVSPELQEPCQNIAKLKSIVIDTHPEINLLRKQVEEQLKLQQMIRNSDIKAQVTLTGDASSDFPSMQPGYGLAMHINVQLPANIKKAGAAQKKVTQTTLKKVQRKLDLKSATLLQEAEEALDLFQASSENVHFATQRLRAGAESVRENLLRSAYLEGDTLEKLQQSRYSYYQSAMDYIDAEMNKLQAQAKLLQFSSDGCQSKTAGLTINKTKNQPIDPVSPLNMDRRRKMKRLSSVLVESQKFPIRGELPNQKINETKQSWHGGPLSNDIVISSQRTLPPAQISDVPKQKLAISKVPKSFSSNFYTVQVGSYRNLAVAETFMKGFINENHKVVIRAADLSEKGPMYRVQMGKFTDNQDAKKLVNYLAEEYGQKAFVVNLKK